MFLGISNSLIIDYTYLLFMSDLQNKKILLFQNTSYKQPLKKYIHAHYRPYKRDFHQLGCLMPDDLAGFAFWLHTAILYLYIYCHLQSHSEKTIHRDSGM